MRKLNQSRPILVSVGETIRYCLSYDRMLYEAHSNTDEVFFLILTEKQTNPKPESNQVFSASFYLQQL